MSNPDGRLCLDVPQGEHVTICDTMRVSGLTHLPPLVKYAKPGTREIVEHDRIQIGEHYSLRWKKPVIT